MSNSATLATLATLATFYSPSSREKKLQYRIYIHRATSWEKSLKSQKSQKSLELRFIKSTENAAGGVMGCLVAGIAWCTLRGWG